MAKQPQKKGRPTKFKKEYCEQAYKLCLLGAIDRDLADFFEVDELTINRWKVAHPGFSKSLKEGKDSADSKVAESLYKRATGYEHPDLQFNVVGGELVKTEVTKHYPPDATSMIFWLKNRQRRSWRDKVDHSVSGDPDNPLEVIKRVIVEPKEG